MTGEKKLLLWALEHLEVEPMCEEAEGVCDFTFEIDEKDRCPCEWRRILKEELEESK